MHPLLSQESALLWGGQSKCLPSRLYNEGIVGGEAPVQALLQLVC